MKPNTPRNRSSHTSSSQPAKAKSASGFNSQSIPGFAARKVAVDILGKVIRDKHALDHELDAVSGNAGLKAMTAQDRNLTRAILGAALRRRNQISFALEQLLERPIPEKSGRAMDILHVASVQILFMDVPDHAAVSLAVSIADHDRRARPYKGLINGVLRRITREREQILQQIPQATCAPWLYERWRDAYGESLAADIASMLIHEPNLDFTVKSDPEGWAKRLGGEVVGAGSIRLTDPSGRIEEIDGYNEGAWWVQDAAAALPARLLGDISNKKVADLCAAPGGKTLQLAAMGGDVTAVDISPSRLKRVKQNLERLQLSAKLVAADLRKWTPEETFDAILLDAPCSATGTARRHPDVSWTKWAGDIEKLTEIQAELLDTAAQWLKPGAMMVYCTCSLEPDEGEAQIEAFLARAPGFRRVPITSDEVAGLNEIITPLGDMRTLPCHLAHASPKKGGLDGFFASRLLRD